MKINVITLVVVIFTLNISLSSCNRKGDKADAYGTFEVDEVTVSSEASGKLISYNVEEGCQLNKNQVVGMVDTIQLELRIRQLITQINAIATKIPNIQAQEDVQREQIRILEIEQERVKSLIKDGAATQKQLDDIDGRVSLAKKQFEAIKVQRFSVNAEVESIKAQIATVQDQIVRCKIVNPIDGTVLVKYCNQSELVNQGKSIYKIANLDYIFLRAYVSGTQLNRFKLGEKVKVYIDSENDQLIESEGIVTWVSSEAEFTPKIIQTKEERVKLVYAVKIKVKNDGKYKIGMPGEVRLIN